MLIVLWYWFSIDRAELFLNHVFDSASTNLQNRFKVQCLNLQGEMSRQTHRHATKAHPVEALYR